MDEIARQFFDRLEKVIDVEPIPKRMTEVREQVKVIELVERVLADLSIPLRNVYGTDSPPIIVGAVSLWDFTAIVGRDRLDRYCVGVGVGSTRLLDVFSVCLSAIIFGNSDEAISRAQKTLGSLLYDYARRNTHRLRHWSIDPTLGLAIPYGFVPLQLGSLVPAGYEAGQLFYFDILLGWVLAHEIAHIIAGDAGSTEDTSPSGDAPQPELEREFSADSTALRLLFARHSDRLRPTFTAVSYFLGILSIVERISTTPVFSGPNHPTPVDRLTRLIGCLPDVACANTPSELDALRSIGLDFLNMSNGIAEWILNSPEDFRMSPFVIEDYQEEPADSNRLDEAARMNQLGDIEFTCSNLTEALSCYLAAEELIRGVDFGEAHRIVWMNLIRTCCAVGQPVEARRWLLEGLCAANQNQDKPTILKLIALFRHEMRSSGKEYWANLSDDVKSVMGSLDDDLRNAIDLPAERGA
jgi:hypothetical protein